MKITAYRQLSILLAPLMIIALLVCDALSPARAEEGFYSGKTVTVFVGFPAGGGYDVYARVLARSLPNHIPGKPTVIVQNMPGAGSLNLANYLYAIAHKDGTMFGTIEPGVPFEALYHNVGVRFDPLKFTWIGGINSEVTTCQVWHTSNVQTFDDLVTKGATFGSTGSGALPVVEPKVINEVFNAKIKLIMGYPGTPDIYGAIEKGEVEGACGLNWSSLLSTRGDWIKQGKLRGLVQFGAVRHPDIKDVPLVTEFARNDADRKLLTLLGVPDTIGRPYLAPPDLPPERTKTLRTAFNATMTDATFLADAAKATLGVNPTTGEEIEAIVADAFKTPPDLVDRMMKARQ